MIKSLKKNWFGIATAVITLTILIIAVVYTMGFDKLVKTFSSLEPAWLCIALGSIFSYWLLDTLILHVFVRSKNKKYKFSNSFDAAMIGLLYSALTPFAVGGQPMQVYLMTKKKVSAGDATFFITIKSALYQTVLLIVAIISSFVAGSYFKEHISNLWFFVIFGVITNSLFILAIVLVSVNKAVAQKIISFFISLFAKVRIIKNKEKTKKSAFAQIEVFHGSIMFVKNQKKELVICFLLTVVQIIIFYSIPYSIYRSFSLNTDGPTIMVAANSLLAMITAFIPLPGASVAAEGGFFVFFKVFFRTDAVALSAVLVWRFITYYMCILVGLFISFRLMLGNKEIREANIEKDIERAN